MGQLLDELNDEGKRLSKTIEYYRVVDNEVSVWLQELLDRRKEDYLRDGTQRGFRLGNEAYE